MAHIDWLHLVTQQKQNLGWKCFLTDNPHSSAPSARPVAYDLISYPGHESMQNLLVSYSSDDGQTSESTDCGSNKTCG